MATIGCSGATGTNFAQLRSTSSDALQHKWEALVFTVPGVGQADLDYIAVAEPTSSYSWRAQPASTYMRIVGVDGAGVPNCADTIYSEMVFTGHVASYTFGAAAYGTKLSLAAALPRLTRGTPYALVVRTTYSSFGIRSLVTNEVPAESAFNSFWAASAAADPPAIAEWTEGIGDTVRNNNYAELGYTSVPYLRMLSYEWMSNQILRFTFNGPVQQAAAETEGNWTLPITLPTFTATRQADTSQVDLAFDAVPDPGLYSIEATGVLDTNGDAILAAYDSLDVLVASTGSSGLQAWVF